MTDTLKEKIIIRAIKAYKNRETWTDEYVQTNYQDCIDYMLEYFDKFFPAISGSGATSTTPTGARVTKIQQGERVVEYDYGDSSSTTTTSGLNAMIAADSILSALLGLPLLKVM